MSQKVVSVFTGIVCGNDIFWGEGHETCKIKKKKKFLNKTKHFEFNFDGDRHSDTLLYRDVHHTVYTQKLSPSFQFSAVNAIYTFWL